MCHIFILQMKTIGQLESTHRWLSNSNLDERLKNHGSNGGIILSSLLRLHRRQALSFQKESKLGCLGGNEEKLGHRYMAEGPKHILILFLIYGDYTLFYRSATIFSRKGFVKLDPREVWLHTSCPLSIKNWAPVSKRQSLQWWRREEQLQLWQFPLRQRFKLIDVPCLAWPARNLGHGY